MMCEADEPGIDDAVEAQDDLPGEDAQQIAGPEGNGDQDQPEDLVPGHAEGQEIGHGIGQQDHRRGGHQRQNDRLHQQDRIDRIEQGKGDAPPIGRLLARLDQMPVIVEGEGRVDAVEILGPEADDDQGDDGHDQHQQHEEHGRRHQEIAAQPFMALQQAASRTGARRLQRARRAVNRAHAKCPKTPPVGSSRFGIRHRMAGSLIAITPKLTPACQRVAVRG